VTVADPNGTPPPGSPGLPPEDPIDALTGQVFSQLIDMQFQKRLARARTVTNAILAHAEAMEISVHLLAKCLPHLRSPEAKPLRARVLRNLEFVEEKRKAREEDRALPG
jgi:hypothetical protein